MVELRPKSMLFGHSHPIAAMAVADSLRVLVSASSNGRILIHDLNDLKLIRELTNVQSFDVSYFFVPTVSYTMQCLSIDDSTGHILVCSGGTMHLWSLNGRLLCEQQISERKPDRIVSCAFSSINVDAGYSEPFILTGQSQGTIKVSSVNNHLLLLTFQVWKLSVSEQGKWYMKLVHQTTLDAKEHVTCLLHRGNMVFAGTSSGLVVSRN